MDAPAVVDDLDPHAESKFESGDGSIAFEPSPAFVITPTIQAIIERALTYLQAGYAVHFSGPAGAGKTTLAFHVATLLGRPAVLLHGDHEFGSSDLVGRESGYRKSRVVDNYIASVMKFQEEGRALWVDNRITTACRLGHTILYDEFNRSRAEANNPFLSILSEGVLNVPRLHGRGEGYVNVHPDFRAIFTSNPAEYAGVHRTQEALLDRVITLRLGHYDRDTEIAITAGKSGLDAGEAETIVDLVRLCRREGKDPHVPTIRACIAIARVLATRGRKVDVHDPVFVSACHDILGSTGPMASWDVDRSYEFISALLRRFDPRAASAKVCAQAPASPAEDDAGGRQLQQEVQSW